MSKIKEALDLKGLRKVWLAKRLGKSYNMVNGYVQSQQQPELEVLTR
jgi:ribosome-binding protein aMBF1 (putative translation factor)